jgi:hypothetical protein
MNRFLDASRRFFLAVGRGIAAAWGAIVKWLSVPVNLSLAALALAFGVSLISWAVSNPFDEAVLFFPDDKGKLRSELRQIPHAWSGEARAELIASELLLGPQDNELRPDFASGTRVESILYRKGRLYVDISKNAALEPDFLKNGITAMERSLRVSLPGISRLTMTIGGIEPYAVGLKDEGGLRAKKTGK